MKNSLAHICVSFIQSLEIFTSISLKMLHICSFISRHLFSQCLTHHTTTNVYLFVLAILHLFPWKLHALMSVFVLCVCVCVCVCVLCVFHCHSPALYGINVNANSLRSFSSDRSNTLNRSSFTRDSMMIEEILAPSKDTVRPLFP